MSADQPPVVRYASGRRSSGAGAQSQGLREPLTAETETSFAGVEESLTFMGACVSLAVSMLGTGIVAFPYSFNLCGYALGPASLIVLGVLSHLSYVSLMACTQKEQVASYGGLLDKVPKAWGHYTNLALWVLLILATTAYVLISADIIRSVAGTNGHAPDLPWYLSNQGLFALILLVILPPCLMKSIAGLALISSYCSVAIVTVVGLIVHLCLQVVFNDPPEHELAPTVQFTAHNSILAVPILGCAMFGHMNISQIYAELKPELKPKANLVSLVTCTGTITIYMIVGSVGYAAFGRGAMADVVAQVALHNGESLEVWVLQALLASFIVLKTPLVILPLRSLTVSILCPSKALSATSHFLVTVSLLACVYLAANLLPDLDKLLEVLGAICVVPLCFVVPARLAWTLEVPRPRVKVFCLAVFGLVASVLSLESVIVG